MAEGMNISASVQVAQQPAVEVRTAESAAQSKPKADPAEATRAAAEQVSVSVEDLQAAIDQLNDFMREGQRSLAFSVDETAEEVVVQVRDKETDEVVRQIPSPEALELKKHLQGVIGLLFNDKA